MSRLPSDSDRVYALTGMADILGQQAGILTHTAGDDPELHELVELAEVLLQLRDPLLILADAVDGRRALAAYAVNSYAADKDENAAIGRWAS